MAQVAVAARVFALAKAAGDPAVARESVLHLRCYVEMLFKPGADKKESMS